MPFITQKRHPPNPFLRSKAPVIGFVRTNDYRRTDVSAPSWSFVRTKTGTCFHFLERKGVRFRRCEIASVRVKRPTKGYKRVRRRDRKKGNRRKYRQCVFRESPEKALPAHQFVFGRNEAPSRALRLTICQKRTLLLPLTAVNRNDCPLPLRLPFHKKSVSL